MECTKEEKRIQLRICWWDLELETSQKYWPTFAAHLKPAITTWITTMNFGLTKSCECSETDSYSPHKRNNFTRKWKKRHWSNSRKISASVSNLFSISPVWVFKTTTATSESRTLPSFTITSVTCSSLIKSTCLSSFYSESWWVIC